MEKGKHYTLLDKEQFLEIVDQFKHIIENKKTDAATNRDKSEAWEQVSQKYSSLALPTGPRSAEQLKMLYKNLKRKARSDKAYDKAEASKTGGGTFTLQINDVSGKVLDIIKDQIDPLKNKFDNNATCMGEVDINTTTMKVDCADPSTSQEAFVDKLLSTSEPIASTSKSLTRKKKFCEMFDKVHNLNQTRINKMEETFKKINEEKLKLCLQNQKVAYLKEQFLKEEHEEQMKLLKLQQINEQLKAELLKCQIEKLQNSDE